MSSVYERVILSLLTESKVDTFARRLTQKVVNATKKKMDDINKKRSLILNMKVQWPGFLKRKDEFGTPAGRLRRAQMMNGQGPSPFGPMEISLKLAIEVIPRPALKDDVVMSAAWAPFHDQLIIQVQVVSTTGIVKPQHLSKIQSNCYEVIRHELEHSTQTSEKLVGGMRAGGEMMSGVPRQVWSNPKTLGDYFLSEAEIEAFVAGIYHKAKRQRVPFVKALDELIERLMRQTTRYGSDAVEMRNVLMTVRWKWLDYAKKRFPKAVVQ